MSNIALDTNTSSSSSRVPNEGGGGGIGNSNNNAPPDTQPVGSTSSSSGGNLPDNAGTAAILARLKELETANQQLSKHIDDMKTDSQRKEEKIKILSADKRKDMEQMVETAIDTWLNSLTGISDEVRKQFRSGVSKIAEQADLKNAAWEVVCQASELHRANVNRIEELVQTCNQQSETIKSLVGSGGGNNSAGGDFAFASDASRMLTSAGTGAENGGGNSNKRPRTEENGGSNQQYGNYNNTDYLSNTTIGGAPDASNNNAWDKFDRLLREEGRSMYF